MMTGIKGTDVELIVDGRRVGSVVDGSSITISRTTDYTPGLMGTSVGEAHRRDYSGDSLLSLDQVQEFFNIEFERVRQEITGEISSLTPEIPLSISILPDTSEIRERVFSRIPEMYGKVQSGTAIYEIVESFAEEIRDVRALIKEAAQGRVLYCAPTPRIDYSQLADAVLAKFQANVRKKEEEQVIEFLEELKKS